MKPIAVNLETDNEYLNVILSEKIQKCMAQDIRLTPYVDGRSLSFINGLDLCVLTGNALDNAIEAVSCLDLSRREIHVHISQSHGMVSFTFQNEYEGTIQTDSGGSILTSKKDSQNHGYGLKGISQIVEKYDGALHIDTDDGLFTLSIILPLPEEG
jgi:sensor histidine kinase regulating citrate/malate metabolism